MSDGPVFLVGFPRSGTTLLDAMMSMHPRLAMTHEWRYIPELLQPRRDGTLRSAIDVIREAADMPMVGMQLVDVGEAERRVSSMEGASPADACRCLFELYAAAVGKPRWGDKTPRNLWHLDVLGTAFPDACFLHLVRDGREVADANRDAPWGSRSLRYWSSQWATGVAAARAAGARLGDRYFEIRYEQLVGDPKGTLQEVCAFIGEDFVDEQLAYQDAVAAYRDVLPAHHHNLLKPPTPGLRDWRSRWTPRQRAAVEAIAGPVLDQLGYPRSMAPPGEWRERRERAVAAAFAIENRARTSWQQRHPTVRGLARRVLAPWR